VDVAIEGLTFQRGERTVLAIDQLVIREGVRTGLLGPNGSGKTTLLRLIGGLERPTTGEVRLGGLRAGAGREQRRNVAYAFQQPVFLTGSVRSNLGLALRLREVAAEERNQRIEAIARACGITPLLDRDALKLSGGEAQRANLARALCVKAPVTLLDEPLSGLDVSSRAGLLHDLPGLLAEASTTILVTHDRQEAMRLCDDLVLLMDGRVQAHGPASEVFRRPPTADTASFLGYQVLPTGRGLVAVRPGALSLGAGDIEFQMVVERVADLGTHGEVQGVVAGTTVRARHEGDAPAEGDAVTISAPEGAVVRFE